MNSRRADLYSFVYRGQLAEAALDQTESLGRFANAANINKHVADKLPIEEMDKLSVDEARRMASVYVAIAAFERTVREFVRKILLDGKGPNWWEDAVSPTIKTRVNSRILEEQKIQWHSPRGEEPLNYTDFGHLGSIIGNNWLIFEIHVRDLEWAKNIFNVIEISRNVCMHSGHLSDRDIERIGALMADWLDQVGG